MHHSSRGIELTARSSIVYISILLYMGGPQFDTPTVYKWNIKFFYTKTFKAMLLLVCVCVCVYIYIYIYIYIRKVTVLMT
jgi:hypothetical protein